MIGMILLMGLVAKNSILLVDLTNQYRAQGRSIDDALSEACPHRMRPVLITSLTVIAAMTPALIGLRPGGVLTGGDRARAPPRGARGRAGAPRLAQQAPPDRTPLGIPRHETPAPLRAAAC